MLFFFSFLAPCWMNRAWTASQDGHVTCMSWFPHDTTVGRDDIELPADIRMLAVGYASGKVSVFFFFFRLPVLPIKCSTVTYVAFFALDVATYVSILSMLILSVSCQTRRMFHGQATNDRPFVASAFFFFFVLFVDGHHRTNSRNAKCAEPPRFVRIHANITSYIYTWPDASQFRPRP